MKKQSQQKEKLHTSVRNLVEFIYREGDIDNRHGGLPSAEAMMEGTRIHKKIQKSRGGDYQAEVPLWHSVLSECVVKPLALAMGI